MILLKIIIWLFENKVNWQCILLNRNAGNTAKSRTKILIRNGVYNNKNYGSGVNNGAAMAIKVTSWKNKVME